MPDFATFDRRRYRTMSVRDGYDAWQPTYEATVEDPMDLALLERIRTVEWARLRRVADLGCGTGRTAAWLTAKGAAAIDGVDVTPAMLDVARERGLHRRLVEADARATSLPAHTYELVICSLVDEHLPELPPLYAEARRLMVADGAFVVVGFHPFFIMASGMPTHFDGDDGEPIAVETYIHLPGDHMAAARAAGLVATELNEALVDEEWIRRKPGWDRYRDWPISFAWVWHAGSS